MRLNRVNIRAFGRLRDLELPLGPGLNVVLAPNEGGKSTLLSFIFAALYGFALPGSRRTLEADYERLRPWQGTDYGGSLHYELASGRRFSVSRDFAAHEVRVFDGSGSDITSDFRADRTRERLFAQEHTGLDRQTFQATVLVEHGVTTRLDHASGIVERLQAMAAAGPQADDTSARGAVERLETALRRVGERESASGTPLGRAATRVRTMENELRDVRQRRTDLDTDLARAGRLRDDRTALHARRDELNHLSNRARLEEGSRLLETLQSVEESVRQVSDELADIEPVSDGARTAIVDLERDSGRPLEAVVERLGAAASSGDASLARGLAEREREEAVRCGRGARAAAFAGIALAAAAVFALIFAATGSAWAILPGAMLAITAAAAGFVFRGRLSAASKAAAAALEREREAGDSERLVRDAQSRLDEVFSATGVSDIDGLQSLAERSRRIEWCLSRLEDLEDRRGTLLAGRDPAALLASRDDLRRQVEARPDLSSLPPTSLGEAERELEFLTSEISRLELEEGQLNGRVGAVLAGCRNLGDIEADLEDATDLLEDVRERREALQCAAKLISDISRDVHEHYARELSGVMNEEIFRVTGRYGTVGFDQDLGMNVFISEIGEWRPVDRLSWGTKEQFYVLLKSALARLLSGSDELLPILLDDAFAHADDERLMRLAEFLVELSAAHQVVLFTCRRSQLEAVQAAAGSAGGAPEETMHGPFTLLRCG